MAKKLLDVKQYDFETKPAFIKSYHIIESPLEVVKEMNKKMELKKNEEGVLVYLTNDEYKKFSGDKNYKVDE